MCGFKLYWADIAQGLMEPLSIVEHLDEFKDHSLRRLMGPEVLIMDQFILERTEETLDHGIVVTVALPTHAGYKPGLCQLPLIGPTHVRGALVRVMDHARLWASVGEHHLQCRQSHVLIQFPTQVHPTTQCEYRSKITAKYTQPARVTMAVRLPAQMRLGAGGANS